MPDERIIDQTEASAPASDDFFALDGPTNGTRKLATSFITAQLAARSRAGRIISDGVTSNRRVQGTYGDAGAVGGLPLSILAYVDVPEDDPAASVFVSVVGPATTGIDILEGNSLLIWISTAGSLFIRQQSTDNDTAFSRSFSWSTTFRSTYSGRKRLPISIVWPEGDSTTDPTITIDNVDVSSNFSSSVGATPPNWLPASGFSPTHFLSGYNWPADDMPTVLYGIGEMSTDEVAAWHRDGTSPAWMESRGNAATAVTDGDMEAAGVSAYDYTGAATLTKTADPADAGNQVLTAPSNNNAYQGFFASLNRSVVYGEVLRVKIRYRRAGTAGNWSSPIFLLRTGQTNVATGGTSIASVYQTVSAYEPASLAVDTWATAEVWFRVTTSSSSAQFLLRHYDGEASVYWDDFEVISLGLLDNPVVLSALVTGDKLGQRSRLIVGGLPVPAEGNADGGTIYGSGTWAGTHEAKDIFGGTVFDSAMPCIVEAVTLAASASSSGTGPTFGNTNDPDQYVTAAAITGGTPKHFGTAALADVFNGGTAANDRNLVIDPDSANYTGTIKATVKFSRVNT